MGDIDNVGRTRPKFGRVRSKARRTESASADCGPKFGPNHKPTSSSSEAVRARPDQSWPELVFGPESAWKWSMFVDSAQNVAKFGPVRPSRSVSRSKCTLHQLCSTSAKNALESGECLPTWAEFEPIFGPNLGQCRANLDRIRQESAQLRPMLAKRIGRSPHALGQRFTKLGQCVARSSRHRRPECEIYSTDVAASYRSGMWVVGAAQSIFGPTEVKVVPPEPVE